MGWRGERGEVARPPLCEMEQYTRRGAGGKGKEEEGRGGTHVGSAEEGAAESQN